MSSLDSGHTWQRQPTGDLGKDIISETARERCHIMTIGPGAHVQIWLSFPLNIVAGLDSSLYRGQGSGG